MSGVSCNVEEEYFGSFPSVKQCADACRNQEQCKFFIYNTKDSGWDISAFNWHCYWEKTTSADCPEGWKTNNVGDYDFYELTSK